MPRRNFAFSIIFLILFVSSLLSENFLNISDVRPPFFILEITENCGKVNRSGMIYSKTGVKVGKFTILERSGNRILCKCLDHSAGMNDGCYIKVGSDPGKIQKLKNLPIINRSEQVVSGSSEKINVRGIMFTEQKNGVFITENPVPVSMVPNISFKGIDSFMKKIESRYGEKCIVSYLETGEIEECFFKREERIMLGLKNNVPVIVSFSGSVSRVNPVSEKIVNKLKYEIYIPLKLRRL